MKLLIQFLLSAVLIPVIDFIWLSKIMQNFYLSELGPLARAENGAFKPLIWPAVIVYFAIAFGIVLFVLPKANSNAAHAFFYGACLGFSIYAVYDFTNLSLIQNWPLRMTFVDVLWGTFLCGLVSFLVQLASRKFE